MFMGDIVSLKTRNIVNALAAVKRDGPLTKSEISERSGITAVSAHNIVNDLLEQKFIMETADVAKNIFSSGRKALSYVLNPGFGRVIGQQMTRGRIATALYSFDSSCVSFRQLEIDESMSPNETLQKMIDEIKALIDSTETDAAKVIGAGVVWPGQVNYETGAIVDLPNIRQYQGLPVKSMMERQLPFRVSIDNDSKSIVLAIKWMKNKIPTENLLYFSSGQYGAAAAIIDENRLLRGANNNAGEIGHVNLMIDGRFESIENLLIDKNITEQCLSLLRASGQHERKRGKFTIEDVIELANGGDEIVLGVLKKSLDIILMSIDICVKAYDPYCVFLNIEWLKKIPSVSEELIKKILKHFEGISYGHLRIKILDVEHLETLGAATLLFNDFFTNKTIQNSLFDYCPEALKTRRKL
jgi:predicted NBD/HSP70 family sugar kinase